jgi:hypothetical protein
MIRELNEFTLNDECQRNFETYMSMMTNAIIEQTDLCVSNLYDHRFFLIDDYSGILKPTCGFVSLAITSILLQADLDHVRSSTMFYDKLNENWVRHGMTNINPRVREFAFKQFSIVQLIREKGGVDGNVQIVRFDGNYPNLNLLGDPVPGKAVIFIPRNNWSVHYVDAVIWEAFENWTTTVALNGNKKKQITHHGGRIEVTGVKMILQSPCEDHESLRFYRPDHGDGGQSDASRYMPNSLKENDIVEHKFMWVLPNTFTLPYPDGSAKNLPNGPAIIEGKNRQSIKRLSVNAA